MKIKEGGKHDQGDEVATRAECWMCSYCPVLASGKRGPATEGMLTVQIGTPNLTLHTHPRGEPLARHPKPARPIDHGFYVEMGDYVVQALRPAGDIDGGQNPAFDAAFLYPGQVLPPHLTRRQHATRTRTRNYTTRRRTSGTPGWRGSSRAAAATTRGDALPAPKRAGFPPIPNPMGVEQCSNSAATYHAHASVPPGRVGRPRQPPTPPKLRPNPNPNPNARSKARDPPPPPPPRVGPVRATTPDVPGGRAPRPSLESGPRTDHLRPAERDRTSWATEVAESADEVVTHRAAAASFGGRTGPATTRARRRRRRVGFDPATSSTGSDRSADRPRCREAIRESRRRRRRETALEFNAGPGTTGTMTDE